MFYKILWIEPYWPKYSFLIRFSSFAISYGIPIKYNIEYNNLKQNNDDLNKKILNLERELKNKGYTAKFLKKNLWF